MADSNITKRALSAALKELMETQPFSKISVGDICEAFYRKTLSIDGQNSFSEYFRSIIAAILAENAEEGPLDEETGRFMVDFYADAFVCAIKRWLLGRDSVTAEEFSQLLKKCLVGTSLKIVRDLGEK